MTGTCSPEIFSILTTLSALSWLFESVRQYLPVPFSLDEALQMCKLFRQSQCPCSCCNECTERQLLSILACVAGARKGKGEGKIGRTQNAQSHHHPCPLPPSRIVSRAQFQFPFSLPFSSACHAGYVNRVCDIISCFVNILSVASKPTHSFHTRMW